MHADAPRPRAAVRAVVPPQHRARAAALELREARVDARAARAEEGVLGEVERRGLVRRLERAGDGREEDVPEEQAEEREQDAALRVEAVRFVSVGVRGR